jgi:hypothetical protein
MIGLRRQAVIAACGHCWHVLDSGWGCCGCPGRVSAKHAPPEAGHAPCQAPTGDDDTITAWLAPPGRLTRPPGGHRPGRRRPRTRSGQR